jgi:signal transduction histidine kinase/ligand-binding sensor domain-containing protein
MAATFLSRRAWGISILMFASATVFAATNSAWVTRAWQTDDGLPNNNIHAIVQGRDGYLWVGTPVGLLRFDGVHFTKFSLADFLGDADPSIYTISPSPAGGLWVVPAFGPVVGLSPDFSPLPLPKTGLPKGIPVALIEDCDGFLWLGYSSAIYQVKNGLVTQFTGEQGVPAGRMQGLNQDSSGKIWLLKGNKACVFRDGQFQPLASLPGGQLHLAAAGTNGVWITAGRRLLKCDEQGGLQDLGAFNPESPRAEATVVMEDHTGAIWIGTDGGGLFRHGGSGFEKIEGLHPYILSLAEDREGNIWAGTAGGGLIRVCPRGIQLEGVTSDASPVEMESICEDAGGRLWGATRDGLLVVRTNEQWQAAFTNASWLGQATCVVADRSGAIWIGTQNRKLHRWLDNEHQTWGSKDGLGNRKIAALLPGSTGDLWIYEDGDAKMQCLHEGQLRNLILPQNIGRISALAEDAAGNIWFGSAEGALLRVKGGQLIDETSQLPVSGRPVCCLYPTRDGSLWIGFGGGGLVRVKDGRFARIGVGQGLTDDYISQMIADDEGWLWFGTDHGIFKIRQQELEQAMADRTVQLRPVVYGRNAGLISLEAIFSTADPYIVPRALRSRDDRVWLLLHTGLAVADPKVLRANPEPPPALLTRVTVDNRPVAAYGGIEQTSSVVNLKTLQGPLRLSPDYRHLEFDFTAINFTDPENLHFRYQLTGFDNDWIYSEAERSATYSRLTTGNYRFRVEASNGDGPWQEADTTPGIIVTPFFWQTWWFQFTVLALFTSAVLGVARFVSLQHLRAKLRALERQTALDQERARIARDIHDDLGGSMTQIMLLSGLVSRDRSEPEKAGGHARQISLAARQVTDTLDEIVWAVNPRNDTLPHLIDYLGGYTIEFLKTTGLKHRMNLPVHPPDQFISSDVRHNLFLAVKEALNNIARHAHASEVFLQIVLDEKSMNIRIEDNGGGFQNEPANGGADGLRNMRQRMQEIGGQFQVESQPGSGTKVCFFFPLSNRN